MKRKPPTQDNAFFKPQDKLCPFVYRAIKVHCAQWNEAKNVFSTAAWVESSPLSASPCPDFGSKLHSGGPEPKGNLRLRCGRGWTETTDMADLAERGRGREGGRWQLHQGMVGWLLVDGKPIWWLIPTPFMIGGEASPWPLVWFLWIFLNWIVIMF